MNHETNRLYAPLPRDSTLPKEMSFDGIMDFYQGIVSRYKKAGIEELPEIVGMLGWCLKEILEHQEGEMMEGGGA